MRGAINCWLSLFAACFLVESWHDFPDYSHAAEIVWQQLVAIGIYNWLWVKEEQ
jgi:hypothetical protein